MVGREVEWSAGTVSGELYKVGVRRRGERLRGETVFVFGLGMLILDGGLAVDCITI